MTEKQKLFCDEYLKDMNATRAYRTVYPDSKNDNSCAASASALLRNPKIREYLSNKMDEIHDGNIADIKEITTYLTAVMRGEHTEETLYLVGKGVQDVTNIKVSEKDRLRAAELLGKRYGMFTDNVSVDVVVPIFNGESEIED